MPMPARPASDTVPPISARSLPASVFNLFTLSTSVSYALDVFGGQRRLVEGLHAEVDVAHANEQAAFLALPANIVNTVIAGPRITPRSMPHGSSSICKRSRCELAEIQAQAGTVPYSTVLSLAASWHPTRRRFLSWSRSRTKRALARGAGGPCAGGVDGARVRLTDLTLPGELPVSLPSDLVRQRPDILAAEATAHAASANIGVATAALLPSVTLSGGLEPQLIRPACCFHNGRAWSLGADVTAPLFEGGTLWYKRKAAMDNYHQAMALYRQTVLAAFEQVADTLRALDHDAQALSHR